MQEDFKTKVIAVYGFLGSGKTTVVMQLAREIVSRGGRVAVVVNEAGDVPIDGKMFEVGGLPVKEIFGGCICCTLVSSLVDTLKALQADATLTHILIEPSGIADAPKLFDSLEAYAAKQLVKVLLLDGPRFEVISKAVKPLITGQMKSAGIILLNKMDAVADEDALRLDALIETFPHKAPLHRVSAKSGLPDELIAGML